MRLQDPSHYESDEALIRTLLDRPHPLLDGITYERLVRDGWARFNHTPGEAVLPRDRFRLRALDPVHPVAPPSHRFQLISTKQHVRFLNTNYSQFPAHHPSRSEPELGLHPSDAAELGLDDGADALVWNERGNLHLRVHHDDRLQPGLVSVPFGWGHAAHRDGRSVNVLTNPAVSDDDQGSAAYLDTWVSISPA